jgi:hypothetical protein
VGNEFSQDRKQGRLTSASATTYKDVLACEHIVFEVVIREGTIEGALANQFLHLEVAGVELADGEGHTGETAWRDHRGDAAASLRAPRAFLSFKIYW